MYHEMSFREIKWKILCVNKDVHLYHVLNSYLILVCFKFLSNTSMFLIDNHCTYGIYMVRLVQE